MYKDKYMEYLNHIKYRMEHKEELKVKRKEWEDKNKNHMCNYHNEYSKKFKIKIHDMLGGKCVRCGYRGLALQIDHVNGNGSKERKKYATSYSYNNYVLKELLKGSKAYQLLCANCNWEKRYENHEYN